MRCTEVKEIGDRLQCNYDKYSFKDPLAQSAPRRKAYGKNDKVVIAYQFNVYVEKKTHFYVKKDRDDNPKRKE